MYQIDKREVAEKISAKYMKKQSTDLEELRELDARVTRPANVFAYVFGVISAIIMGSGMSLVMTDIAEKIGLSVDPMVPGIVIGVVGMLMAIINYPLHKRILSARKKKYAPQILVISDRIINNN